MTLAAIQGDETIGRSIRGPSQPDFIATSDARLKTNVRQFTDVQEELGQIRGVSFEWNGAGVVRPLRRADSYGCGKWLGNCDLPERRIRELVTRWRQA